MERDEKATSEAEASERDLAIFEERLTGRAICEIAKQFGMTVKEVDSAIKRCCQPIDQDLRLRTVVLELERCDRLTRVFYQSAAAGDVAAAAVLLRGSAGRSALLGVDTPSNLRSDPVLVTIEQAPKPSTTDKIQAALDQLAAAQRPALASGNGHEPGTAGGGTETP